MKNLIIIWALFSIGFLLNAQEMSTDFQAAKNQAESESKNIILVFSGSDWCLPCMKLKKYILDTPEFQNEVEEKYVMINADFPQKKKNKSLQSEDLQLQNKRLAETYNPKGYFPFVVVLTPDLEVIGGLMYEEISPAEFAAKIKELNP